MMKNVLSTIFRASIGIVLIGKILNWFLNFSDGINQMLNTSMFCLIGIAYIVIGYVWNKKLVKIIIITCGLFLIIMNFFPKNAVLYMLGIACILTPVLIARFNKEKEDETTVMEVK